MFCGFTVPSFKGWTRGLSEKPIVSRNVTVRLARDGSSARYVAPDDIASARPPFAALLDHPLGLGLDEIEQGIAADADETMRLEQRLDLFPRPATEERQPVTDRGIFVAGAGILRRLYQETGVELPVQNDKAPAWPQNANPLVDRCLGMRQCPQHMAADREVEAARRERQLLGVGLLETNRGIVLRRLAPRLGEHRRREIDAGDPVATSR